MPANNELKVTIVGPYNSIMFNDYDSGTPAYILRGTAELLSTLSARQTRTAKQGSHGVNASLPFYEDRPLPFEGELQGSSQSDRKTKEEALKMCLVLPAQQSYAGNDGSLLVQFEDEDGTLKQCYATVIQMPRFHVLDNVDPSQRGFDFLMNAADPNLYGQTLQEEEGIETVIGTNFMVVEDESPTVPFTLYQSTAQSLTADNDGTVDAPPIIIVDGPTENPKILNQTTGVFMHLNANGGLTLVEGERVEIDVNAATITKFDVAEAETDVSGTLSNDSDWLFLQPGENEIALLDDTGAEIEAEITVQWRHTYI